MPGDNRFISPEQMFADELSAVFVRWYEESDLDEEEMGSVALKVIEGFCDTTVGFTPDFDLDDDDDN